MDDYDYVAPTIGEIMQKPGCFEDVWRRMCNQYGPPKNKEHEQQLKKILAAQMGVEYKMNDDYAPIRVGLWKKDGNKGPYYANGKPVEINGGRYWVKLFKNDNENPKSPELDLILQLVEEPRPEPQPVDRDADFIPF